MDLPPEFLTLYSRLDRQGPGTPEDVLWALGRLGLTGDLRVCDAGCGTGADTVTLARALPQAQVEGLDAVPAFIEAGQARVADLPNATLRVGDMAALEGPYDLIWSAGAIYFLGVTEGLRAWRAALAPGGTVAFSQGVFLGGDEPQACSPTDAKSVWAACDVIEAPRVSNDDLLLVHSEAHIERVTEACAHTSGGTRRRGGWCR